MANECCESFEGWIDSATLALVFDSFQWLLSEDSAQRQIVPPSWSGSRQCRGRRTRPFCNNPCENRCRLHVSFSFLRQRLFARTLRMCPSALALLFVLAARRSHQDSHSCQIHLLTRSLRAALCCAPDRLRSLTPPCHRRAPALMASQATSRPEPAAARPSPGERGVSCL